jgi:hypothetical protein
MASKKTLGKKVSDILTPKRRKKIIDEDSPMTEKEMRFIEQGGLGDEPLLEALRQVWKKTGKVNSKKTSIKRAGGGGAKKKLGKKVSDILTPPKKKKKKGKGSLGEGKWDYLEGSQTDPKSPLGAASRKKPTPEQKAIAKAHKKTTEHSQEGGKRGSEKWLPSRTEEGYLNPFSGKEKRYTAKEKAYIKDLAKRLEDAEKTARKGGGQTKPKPKKIKKPVGMSATFPRHVKKSTYGVTAKKHGGKITYKMSGGQVVDAGYD